MHNNNNNKKGMHAWPSNFVLCLFYIQFYHCFFFYVLYAIYIYSPECLQYNIKFNIFIHISICYVSKQHKLFHIYIFYTCDDIGKKKRKNIFCSERSKVFNIILYNTRHFYTIPTICNLNPPVENIKHVLYM